MFDYLNNYNQLPPELRARISTPAVSAAIEELEKKYSVSLATLVMRVMVKEISAHELGLLLVEEMKMETGMAESLARELKTRVFSAVADYLGLGKIKPPAAANMTTPAPATQKENIVPPPPFIGRISPAAATMPQDITPARPASSLTATALQPASFKNETNNNSIFFFSPEDEEEIKELAHRVEIYTSGNNILDNFDLKLEEIKKKLLINFSSTVLSDRFKQILLTYIKGIRKKIETREALMRPVSSGGLEMNMAAIDQIFFLLEEILSQGKFEEKIPLPKVKVPEDNFRKNGYDELYQAGLRDVDYDLAALAAKAKSVPDSLVKENQSTPVLPANNTIEQRVPLPPVSEVALKVASSVADKRGFAGKMYSKLDLEHELTAPKPQLKIGAGNISMPSQPVQNPSTASQPVQKLSPQIATGQSISIDKPAVPDALRTSTGSSPAESKKAYPEKQPEKPWILSEEEVKKEDLRKNEEKNIVKTSLNPSYPSPSAGPAPAAQIRRVAATERKPKMEDVKYVPKIMGPIEELKYLDLINFRRMGSLPAKAVAKIQEKINFLEEEHFNKKIEAIKAWRLSPVYKLYLDIGHESINSKKSITEVIETRKKAKQDYLTSDEFDAIMDLNRSLRF